MIKLCSVSGACSLASWAAAWTVTSLHPPGQRHSECNSAFGLTRVGIFQGDGSARASVWTAGSSAPVDLTPPGISVAALYDVWDNVQVGVVGFNGTRATLWNGTPGSRVDLHPAGASGSHALGVYGSTQVGYVTFSGGAAVYRASRWSGSAQSWVSLHPQGADDSFAYDIFGGTIVGATRSNDREYAAIWNGAASSHINLNPAGSQNSAAFTTYGGVQGGYAQVGTSFCASLWSGSASSWVNLAPEGVAWSEVRGIYGDIQVGSFGNGPFTACLWQGSSSSLQPLPKPAGFSIAQANSVTSDGINYYIVGKGYNQVALRTEALLWTQPVPEPLTVSGFIAAFLVSMTRRRPKVA